MANMSDQYTKQLIKELKNSGYGNYTKYYKQIKSQLYDNGIYNGNYDCTFIPKDSELKSIRIIQEDEFDNDDAEYFSPNEKQLAFIGGYIFVEENDE